MRDQPKRRVTYQYGTLARESRKRGPDVWTFRIFQIVNGRRVRCKKIIGTTAEFTEAEAERECEPLRVAANMENPHPTISMRALIYCYMEKILLPSLDVPLGGVQDEAARMGYDCASGYRSSLRNYVLPQWGSYNVRDFEKPEIRYKVEDWFQSLLRSAKNPEGLAGRSLTKRHA